MKPCGDQRRDARGGVGRAERGREGRRGVPPEARGRLAANIVVDPDTIKIAGAQWTAAWNPAQTTTDGTLHIQAASLYPSRRTPREPDRSWAPSTALRRADYLRARHARHRRPLAAVSP
jgi:hypothetical protein